MADTNSERLGIRNPNWSTGTSQPPPKPTKELPLEAKPEAEGGPLAERQRSRGGEAFSGAC
ncbi:MAG: hypothetical protein JNL58_14850 [Planctomyces sp.]|nr:hypothetical protein [Planctomyces sp.]